MKAPAVDRSRGDSNEMQSRHVLILNQHGDNRGDEAAFRAMFAAIEQRVGGAVRFTVLHQFRGGEVNLRMPQEVDWISLVPNPFEAARISLFALFLAMGIEWRGLLGRWGRSVLDACKSCEIAISAPGGPYFGDLYSLQEPVHWFYVWLAGRYRKPLLLYAPSVGPFHNGALNMLRRIMFRRFSRIAVREQVSLEYLKQLLGNRHPPIVLAADSALQRPLSPYRKADYFSPPREGLAGRLLVGVSALEWTFPGAGNRRKAQSHYEEVLMQTLRYLYEMHRAHFLFVPQLYGMHHTDVPFLQHLAARLPAGASWELVDPNADSDHQQRVFGMVDVCVASRYHPMVFALNHAVPAVALYYQHKALGVLRHFGLERFGIPIDQVSVDACRAALDEAIERREEISAQIKERLPHVRSIAARSTDLVVELMARGDLPCPA